MAGAFVFKFDVAGDQQIMRGFSRFAENVKDLREPFEDIASDFEKISKEQFESEGSYGGSGWAPLSPKYAEWKHKRHPGKPILVLNGSMKSSLTGRTDDTIREINPQAMRLGTSKKYAIYHQKGTRNMPARELIKLTDSDKRRWTKIIQEYLVTQARKEIAGLMPDIMAGQKAIKNMR